VKDDGLEELGKSERELAEHLRKTLRESETVDPATAAQLSAARARALQSPGKHEGRRWVWVPAGLTAAAVVAALLVQLAPHRLSGEGETATAEALEVLTDDVDTELYEDLEMYRWLEEDSRA
jgi:hypothetical protein